MKSREPLDSLIQEVGVLERSCDLENIEYHRLLDLKVAQTSGLIRQKVAANEKFIMLKRNLKRLEADFTIADAELGEVRSRQATATADGEKIKKRLTELEICLDQNRDALALVKETLDNLKREDRGQRNELKLTLEHIGRETTQKMEAFSRVGSLRAKLSESIHSGSRLSQ